MLLKTQEEVVRRLGGVNAVGRMFGYSHSAVSNWVYRDGHFPANTFPVIRDACAELGHQVDERLWDWVKPNGKD